MSVRCAAGCDDEPRNRNAAFLPERVVADPEVDETGLGEQALHVGVTMRVTPVVLQREVGKVQDETARARNPAELVDRIMQPCLLSLAASNL